MFARPVAVSSASVRAPSIRAISLSTSATKAAEDLFCSGGQAATSDSLALSSSDRWSFIAPEISPHAATWRQASGSSSSLTIAHSRGVLYDPQAVHQLLLSTGS